VAERIVRGMRLANMLLGDEEIAPVFATAAAQIRPCLRVLPKWSKQLDIYSHGILAVFRIQIRRIRKFKGLPDPDPSITRKKI
jgi:hypothetical protein